MKSNTQLALLDAPSAGSRADLAWLRKAEHWGEWVRFADDAPGDRESIWMMRGANGSVRFYAKGKGQVGPRHTHVVSASAWAWANRWLWLAPDGTLDILGQLACRTWVLDGGAEKIVGQGEQMEGPYSARFPSVQSGRNPGERPPALTNGLFLDADLVSKIGDPRYSDEWVGNAVRSALAASREQAANNGPTDG